MHNENGKLPYKPIRSTVVETKEDWIKLWELAMTPPTPEQLKNAEEWKRFFFPERFK